MSIPNTRPRAVHMLPSLSLLCHRESKPGQTQTPLPAWAPVGEQQVGKPAGMQPSTAVPGIRQTGAAGGDWPRLTIWVIT